MNSALHGIGMTSQRTRTRMIERLREQGIADERVLAAMAAVPRHIFVEEALESRAYDDMPLPIGYNQTISQPYIVARMTELLLAKGPLDKVLEIGTGSGYQTAILATLAERVCTAERIRPLALRARKCLDSLGLFNVMLRINDNEGSPIGWQEEAPFDAIIVTAGAPDVPPVLVEQLAPGGCLVIPVGDETEQRLLKIVKQPDGELETVASVGCRFVPLVGKNGWSS